MFPRGYHGLLCALAPLLLPAAALANETIAIPPELAVQMPDGATRLERSGSWQLSAPPRADTLADTPGARRKVLFLLDLSKSMPSIHGRHGSFEGVVADVVARASAMLEPYRNTDALEVSFYTFGDLRQRDGRWLPHVDPLPNGLRKSAKEALQILPTFVPTAPTAYAEPWTYVAAAAWEAVRRELNLADDPKAALPADMPPIALFVFTDAGDADLGGGESHDRRRRFTNAPYTDWLQGNIARQKLEYHYWDLTRQDLGPLKPPAQLTYLVTWTDAGRAGRLNRAASLADTPSPLALAPTITLTPLLSELAESRAKACKAPVNPDVVNIPPVPLRLSFTGATDFRFAALESYPVGRHSIRLSEDELCRELRRVYPNSSFLFPADDAKALAPLGYVEVVQENVYGATWLADGAAPDAPWPTLEADRLHLFTGATRKMRMDVASVEGLQVETRWRVAAFRADGDAKSDKAPVALKDILELAGFRAASPKGGATYSATITSQGSKPVELVISPARQAWWASFPLVASFLGDHRLDLDAGTYDVTVCAAPRALALPRPGDAFAFQGCPDCAKPPTANAAGEYCRNFPVVLEERPLHWMWVVVWLATLWWVARQVWRWYQNPEWPRGLVLHIASDEKGTRAGQEIGIGPNDTFYDAAYWRWARRRNEIILDRGSCQDRVYVEGPKARPPIGQAALVAFPTDGRKLKIVPTHLLPDWTVEIRQTNAGRAPFRADTPSDTRSLDRAPGFDASPLTPIHITLLPKRAGQKPLFFVIRPSKRPN